MSLQADLRYNTNIVLRFVIAIITYKGLLETLIAWVTGWVTDENFCKELLSLIWARRALGSSCRRPQRPCLLPSIFNIGMCVCDDYDGNGDDELMMSGCVS